MPFSLNLPFLPAPYFYGKNKTLSAHWRPHLQPPPTMNMPPKYKIIFLDKKIKLYTGSLPFKSGLLESKHRTNTILEKPYIFFKMLGLQIKLVKNYYQLCHFADNSPAKFNSYMFPRLLVLMGHTVPVLYTLGYFDPLSNNYFLQTSL